MALALNCTDCLQADHSRQLGFARQLHLAENLLQALPAQCSDASPGVGVRAGRGCMLLTKERFLPLGQCCPEAARGCLGPWA